MEIKRGEVYLADLDPIVGSEQGGVRPVVVIQNDITDYNAQAEDLNGKIKELRAKRKKIISEDENDELLSTLRDLNQIIAEYEKSPRFDDELFEQIIESAVMEDNAHITFALIGGIKLTEEIEHRGRRGTA